jgi:hypothetical protein
MKYKYKIGDQVTLHNCQVTIVAFDKGISWPSYEVQSFGEDETFYVDEDSIEGLT